jgi:hypothetical protein
VVDYAMARVMRVGGLVGLVERGGDRLPLRMASGPHLADVP